jgi:hypothetical protein
MYSAAAIYAGVPSSLFPFYAFVQFLFVVLHRQKKLITLYLNILFVFQAYFSSAAPINGRQFAYQ